MYIHGGIKLIIDVCVILSSNMGVEEGVCHYASQLEESLYSRIIYVL